MFRKVLILSIVSFLFNVHAAEKINGAGATFPYPIYSKWFAEYQKTNKNVEFNYQSIGSGGGIKQVLNQTVDFGASDAPMTEAEIKQAKTPIHQIPAVLGGVVLAYNVKGLENNIKLDGATIANIFLGKITKWNDAAIAKLNPKSKLPAVDILVVRRSDGSGTTHVFTEYVASESSDFKSVIGAGKNVNWQTGLGAKGNEGVTAMVAQTDGAIGYIELAYAINNKLSMAAVKNKAGEFVVPTAKSISKAADFIKDFSKELTISTINAEGKGVYPISSFTYILLPEDKNSSKLKEVRNFLKWAMKDGQKMAEGLHYAPLPKKMTEAITKKL